MRGLAARRHFRRWKTGILGLGAALLLAGCGSSAPPRSTVKGTTSPSAVASISTLRPVACSAVSAGASPGPIPTSVVTIPSAVGATAEGVFAGTSADVLAPASWKCIESIFGDGSETISAFPASEEKSAENFGVPSPEGIVYSIGNGGTQSVAIACEYFPAAAQLVAEQSLLPDPSTACVPPPGTTVTPYSGTVAKFQAADSHGVDVGAAIWNQSSPGPVYEAVLTCIDAGKGSSAVCASSVGFAIEKYGSAS